MLADAPAEQQRAQLLGGGVTVSDHFEICFRDAQAVGVLNQEAAGDLLEDAGCLCAA